MSQTPKATQTVKDLVYLLEHPRKWTFRRASQPSIDREEVRKNMRSRWKDPGFCSLEFQKPSVLKAAVLTGWQIERINLATRSFKTPKQSKPYRFDQKSRQFPKLTTKLYPIKFQRYLKQVQEEKEDLLFKEKGTKTATTSTQRRYLSQIIDGKQQIMVNPFKPASNSTSYFGFTLSKQGKRKFTTSRFKTTNI